MGDKSEIAQRLREVLLDGKWVANTNFKEQLLSVSMEEAVRKIGNLNTIALLTYHVNYYLKGILDVLNGGDLLIKDKYSFDLPAIRTDEDWHSLVREFIHNSEMIVKQIEKLNENLMNSTFVHEKYGTYRRNLEGLIEHSYYHLGQISLLRKMFHS